MRVKEAIHFTPALGDSQRAEDPGGGSTLGSLCPVPWSFGMVLLFLLVCLWQSAPPPLHIPKYQLYWLPMGLFPAYHGVLFAQSSHYHPCFAENHIRESNSPK